MSYGEEQRKEIETIKKRQIKLELSDADCDRLARKCGEYGLTIGELIENFVGDLVDGTYSNGSDERMYAQQWFERCWFGMFPEPSLLNHLLSEGHEPQHFLDALNNIETAKRDIYHHKYNDDFTSYKIVHAYNNVEEFIEHEKECLESYKDDLREWTEERDMMLENWDSSNVDLEEEIENVKKWVSEKDNLLKIIDNKKTDIEKKENKKVKKTSGIRVR